MNIVGGRKLTHIITQVATSITSAYGVTKHLDIHVTTDYCIQPDVLRSEQERDVYAMFERIKNKQILPTKPQLLASIQFSRSSEELHTKQSYHSI